MKSARRSPTWITAPGGDECLFAYKQTDIANILTRSANKHRSAEIEQMSLAMKSHLTEPPAHAAIQDIQLEI